jgi:hypothetical protein
MERSEGRSRIRQKAATSSQPRYAMISRRKQAQEAMSCIRTARELGLDGGWWLVRWCHDAALGRRRGCACGGWGDLEVPCRPGRATQSPAQLARASVPTCRDPLQRQHPSNARLTSDDRPIYRLHRFGFAANCSPSVNSGMAAVDELLRQLGPEIDDPDEGTP